MENKNKKYIWIGLLIGLAVVCYSWFGCRQYCTEFLREHYLLSIDTFLVLLRKTFFIILLFILFRIIQSLFIHRFMKTLLIEMYDKERYESLRKVATFFLWFIFIFLCLSIFIGNFTALLASVGLIGFGLTFALQKPILNLVGWLTILFKGLYHEGDRIRVGGVVGDVKEIQVMNTIVSGLLETSDTVSGKIISIPNELVLTTDVENYTKESNYIVNELKISITYESDYRKAMRLLEEIIIKQVSRNRKKYIKKMFAESKKLDEILAKWVSLSKRSRRKEGMDAQQIEKIKKEQEAVQEEIKDLEEEFRPAIRLEMLDSSVQLIAQFKCPYTEVKKNRTEINLAFLDAAVKDDDIEIAYPHMQIVKNKERKTTKKKKKIPKEKKE